MSPLQGHETSQAIDPEQRVLDQFHTFPFSSDQVFQQGLSGILAHESMGRLSDNEKAELVLKTKVFYFNRVTGHDISLTDVCTHYTVDPESGNERNQTISGAQREETRTLSFAELKSLIERGKTDDIPNNKVIPNVLNDGVPSESTTPLRRKPWEDPGQS